MANTRFGNFQELSQGKKPMTAEEAWAMLNQLGLLGQEFVPGAVSIRKVFEGKPREAVEELQDWIPGNAAYQNLIRGKDQDWVRNALDLAIVGKPLAKGAKKAMEAIEMMPKGGKEGFIVLKKNQGENKLKDVIEASNEAGQTITPEIEKEIRDHIGLVHAASKNPSKKSITQQNNHYDKMSTEAKQVIDAYLGQQQVHSPKPAGFDALPAEERKAILEQNFKEMGADPDELLERSRALKDQNYGGHYDYGVIYPDQASLDDYAKAVWDVEHAPKPITTTQVEDMSTGIIPLNNEVVSKGGHRNTYDHSRTFTDSELKQVPGIDRTGMSYGDNTDAFYDLYKAWKDNPGRENQAINEIIKESKSKPSKVSKVAYDPYYNAGVVGDLNHKLWGSIKGLRHKGYSDEEIRTILKDKLDEYQGKLERFKARMPSSHNGAQFDYDGALTTSFHALPSEEARALKALGVDTPEYDELERLGNFYRVFFPK